MCVFPGLVSKQASQVAESGEAEGGAAEARRTRDRQTGRGLEGGEGEFEESSESLRFVTGQFKIKKSVC